MDRARKKPRARKVVRLVIVVGAVLAVISGGVTLANIDFTSYRVDREKLSIATVQQGQMEVKVSANGELLSRNIEQLAAQVSGRVAVKKVQPGAVVEVGQVLVELANPELAASAEEAHSAWVGAVAAVQAADAELQGNILNQEVSVTRVQLDLDKARLRARNNKVLADAGVLPEMELSRSELDQAQLIRACAIEQTHLQKLRDNVQAQLAVRQSRVTELSEAYNRATSQAADLKVVAGIRGIVQSIDVEVGQQLEPGSPIGRIAQQDQLYAELKVPAREAGQVQMGQSVMVDTRNGTVNGTVTRVNPGVSEGTVVVDADLQGPLPAGARPQLQVDGTIYISRMPNAQYVGKTSYVKNDAAITVYKLDRGGRYASRTLIKVGKVSLNYMQVLQGLNPGDQIITSEVGAFQDHDRILLK